MSTTTSTTTSTTGTGRVLPQLRADLFVSDGGLETSIMYQQGVALPDFAAFVLLDSDDGRDALRRYYGPYFELAARIGRGIVADTPTWRASLDWGARLGYDADAMAEINRRAVAFVAALSAGWPAVETVVNGAIGPRGDGYVVGATMSVAEATTYHALQARAFADAGATMLTAVTMNYVEEATGIALAAEQAGIPSVVSFTVETDGRLPSGQPLGEAITQVDEATGGAPAYFMVNCAHPTHFNHVLDGSQPWAQRIQGIRANASTLSHEELDAATDLDRGDIAGLADHYVELRAALPGLRVVGGCCGTDHEHVTAMAHALV